MANALPDLPGSPHDDYAFYLAHADEVGADLRSHRAAATAAMQRLRSSARIRLLDLGCGPGTFSARFLQELACEPKRLELTLVDPHRERLARATQALAAHTEHPIQALPLLPEGPLPPMDIVLANQSCYYVNNLEEVLPRLAQALSPHGVMLATIGGAESWLLQLWRASYAALGIAFPHHTADAVDAILGRHRLQATVTKVAYRLQMPDTQPNRARILRLLMGDRYAQLPAQLLDHYAPFANSGRIDVPIVHRHYAIHPSRC